MLSLAWNFRLKPAVKPNNHLLSSLPHLPLTSYLCHYPFGIWTKERIYEGFLSPPCLGEVVGAGANEDEVMATVLEGERFPAKFGRIGFRRNFPFEGQWRGRNFSVKQVEVYAVEENGDWLVITVIMGYY
jgi:hypothetical protein